jgi:WD40-like Beta Propeller Repeat
MTRSRSAILAGGALLVGAVIAAMATRAVMHSVTSPAPPQGRFTIAPAGPRPLAVGSPYRDLALSPDGTHIVYSTATGPTNSALWVRAIDQLDAVPLRGMTGIYNPFFSPDGRSIGFGAAGELKKVSLTGGPPIAVCRITGQLRGATWGPNDTIVFGTNDVSTGLLSVPAAGGEPKVLSRPDTAHGEADHVFPSVLPNGNAVLFTIMPAGSIEDPQVAVLDLKTGQRKTLIRGGGQAEYVAPSTGSADAGFLVYAAAGTLRAARFDPVRLEMLGDPVPVVEQVLTKGTGAADFSLSRSGMLVYVPGGGASARRSLVWVTRQEREEPIQAPPRAYEQVRISPDGTRVAVVSSDQERDIWIWDLAHAILNRLTLDPATDLSPLWTPDGHYIIFDSERKRRGAQFVSASFGQHWHRESVEHQYEYSSPDFDLT